MFQTHLTVFLNIAEKSLNQFSDASAGFQLHSGSEGGAAQPAVKQSRAGHDQTM